MFRDNALQAEQSLAGMIDSSWGNGDCAAHCCFQIALFILCVHGRACHAGGLQDLQRFTNLFINCKSIGCKPRGAAGRFRNSIYDLQENLEVSIEEFRDNQYTDSATY